MRALIVIFALLLAACQSTPEEIKEFLEKRCGHSHYTVRPGAHPELGQVTFDAELGHLYTYRC